VDYYAFVKGETQTLHYTSVPAKEVRIRVFLRHFMLKMHHFTKTGSAQT
jgi:hypothetical protein